MLFHKEEDRSPESDGVTPKSQKQRRQEILSARIESEVETDLPFGWISIVTLFDEEEDQLPGSYMITPEPHTSCNEEANIKPKNTSNKKAKSWDIPEELQNELKSISVYDSEDVKKILDKYYVFPVVSGKN